MLITKYYAPVEPGHVMIFARSVGDVDPCYESQIDARPGTALVTSPTFVRALDHFNRAARTRPTLPRQEPGYGGRADTVHAAQYFEYLGPFRAGDRLTGEISPGRTWTREGASGKLEFTETVTDYRNQDGDLLVRARKVSVKVGPPGGARA